MQTDKNNDKIKNNYKKKYRLNPKLTNTVQAFTILPFNPTAKQRWECLFRLCKILIFQRNTKKKTNCKKPADF